MTKRLTQRWRPMLCVLLLVAGCRDKPAESRPAPPASEPLRLAGRLEEAAAGTITLRTEAGEAVSFVLTAELEIVGELRPNRRAVLLCDVAPSGERRLRSVTVREPTRGERAQELLAALTTEQKIGQLFMVRCPEIDAAAVARQYQPGGYILFARDFEGETPQSVFEKIQSYQEASAIPMLIGVDEEGGLVNRVSRFAPFRAAPFASPRALYHRGGLELIASDAAEKAALLASLGINLNFAPVCDVSTNPGDFIYSRALGQNAETTAQYVKTVVESAGELGVGSMLKHFPGYGGNKDTHTGSAYDSRSYETFVASDFLPFAAGIEAGADAVLVSHNVVACMDAGRPASLSPRVHEILRLELGFEGVVITDDLVMEAVLEHAESGEAAVLALEAGNDMLCSSDLARQYEAVRQAVESGRITRERLDQSVARVLALKLRLGLLE